MYRFVDSNGITWSGSWQGRRIVWSQVSPTAWVGYSPPSFDDDEPTQKVQAPPVRECDCGARAVGTTHANWCSTREVSSGT